MMLWYFACYEVIKVSFLFYYLWSFKILKVNLPSVNLR